MLAFLFLLAVLAAFVSLYLRRERFKLPPGPKGIPIFGNLFQVPFALSFTDAAQLAKDYGPIISYRLMGQVIVLLNTGKTSTDVLDRQSSKASDRPGMIKARDFFTKDQNFALLPKGDKWRSMRRAAHQSLSPRGVKEFEPMMQEEAVNTVRGLLEHPEVDLEKHTKRVASSMILRGLFGSQGIPLIGGAESAHRIEEISREFIGTLLPGGSIVDIMPFLKPIIDRSPYLRKQSDNWYAKADKAYMDLYHNRILGQPSLCNTLHETREKFGLGEHESAWTAGVTFTAAQETTTTAVQYFFLAMLLFPDTAKTAQKQLQSVVGDRPPSFADWDNLPFIEAIVKEVLRWRPPIPLSLPHAASETIEYDGYIIPKGTVLIANLYTISRDPALYENGDAFDPSRFIDEKGKLKKPFPDAKDDYAVFGHGLRICSGKDFAIKGLWITIATVLWAFDIKKALDEKGQEITPDSTAFLEGTATVRPIPFPVKVVPRFADLEDRLGPASGNN